MTYQRQTGKALFASTTVRSKYSTASLCATSLLVGVDQGILITWHTHAALGRSWTKSNHRCDDMDLPRKFDNQRSADYSHTLDHGTMGVSWSHGVSDTT